LIEPLAAARLLAIDYREPKALTTLATLEVGGCCARIVTVDADAPVLLIRGTDQATDWLYNLRFLPMPRMEDGDTRTWHRGFLIYARHVYSFARGWRAGGRKLAGIAGHSLGAAAAQIVGPSLRVPTLAFASPRPLWSRQQPTGHRLVTNWCRTDDWVCKLPPIGFQHVGQVTWLKPASRNCGEDHGIRRYVELLEASSRSVAA
jgi:hypothetical protein